MKTFNLGQINHFVLTKQHLTDESCTENILQIIDDIFGLQATIASTPYLSLFSRAIEFARENLEEELYKKRNLGKLRCIRRTLYILPKDMITVAFAATVQMVSMTSGRFAQNVGMPKGTYQEISARIKKILKGRGMTTSEIRAELNSNENISAVVNLMCDLGILIRGKSPKGWKSNTHSYYLFKEYFNNINLNSINDQKARKLLIQKYISAFGPVTESDIVWWTGLRKNDVRKVLEEINDSITELEIKETGKVYLVLKSDLKKIENSKQKANLEVRLLPQLDPYLMGYKERERYLDSKLYDYIFDRSGNVTSTILLDGWVIGIWDVDSGKQPKLKIYVFNKTKDEIRKKILVKAKEIGKFISENEVQVQYCNQMTQLTKRTAGGFMSPLKNC